MYFGNTLTDYNLIDTFTTLKGAIADHFYTYAINIIRDDKFIFLKAYELGNRYASVFYYGFIIRLGTFNNSGLHNWSMNNRLRRYHRPRSLYTCCLY